MKLCSSDIYKSLFGSYQEIVAKNLCFLKLIKLRFECLSHRDKTIDFLWWACSFICIYFHFFLVHLVLDTYEDYYLQWFDSRNKVDWCLLIEIKSNKTSQENYNSHQLLICTFIGLTELFIRIGFHCKNNTRPWFFRNIVIAT